LKTKVSQGSVVTRLCGEISNHNIIANLLPSSMVKEFWKSVNANFAKLQTRVECPAFLTHGIHPQFLLSCTQKKTHTYTPFMELQWRFTVEY